MKRVLVALVLLIGLVLPLMPTRTVRGMYGSGTALDPYIIMTQEDLESVSTDPWSNYELGQDISLTVPFTPISSFSGTLDGRGYTIYGLEVELDPVSVGYSSGGGLVTKLRFGYLLDIGVSDASVKASNLYSCGILVGEVESGYIDGCHVTGTLEVLEHDTYWEGLYAGFAGSVFEEASVIQNCSAEVEIIAVEDNTTIQTHVAGFVGSFTGHILDHCSCAAEIVYDTSWPYATCSGFAKKLYTNSGASVIAEIFNCDVDVSMECSGESCGFALIIDDCEVYSCCVKGSIRAPAASGFTLGVQGDSGFVRDCYSRVDLDASLGMGAIGFVARIEYGYVENCYYAGVITIGENGVGVCFYDPTFSTVDEKAYNCVYDSTIIGIDPTAGEMAEGLSTGWMQSYNVLSSYGWDFDDVWAIDTYNDGYPYLQMKGEGGPGPGPGSWPGEGSGSSEDPYIITSWSEFSTIGDYFGYYFALGGDIDASGASSPIESFSGFLDGRGYSVKDLDLKISGETSVGLFQVLEGAFVVNLKVEDANIELKGVTYGGILAGSMNESFIGNCYVSGTLSAEVLGSHLQDAAYGGLVGYCAGDDESTVSYSSAEVDITIKESSSYLLSGFVGGFVGEYWGYGIDHCWYRGTIVNKGLPGLGSGMGLTGGFAGFLSCGDWYGPKSVSYCACSADMSGYGGFCGFAYAVMCEIEECYAIGSISGSGVILGTGFVAMLRYSDSYIRNCYSRVNITSPNSLLTSGFLSMAEGSPSGVGYCYYAGIIQAPEVPGTPSWRTCFYEEVGQGDPCETEQCMYDSSIVGLSETEGEQALGVSTLELKSYDTFEGSDWDFEGVWSIYYEVNDGYPFLRRVALLSLVGEAPYGGDPPGLPRAEYSSGHTELGGFTESPSPSSDFYPKMSVMGKSPKSVTIALERSTPRILSEVRYSLTGYPATRESGYPVYSGYGSSFVFSPDRPSGDKTGIVYYLSSWGYDPITGEWSEGHGTLGTSLPIPPPKEVTATEVGDTSVRLKWIGGLGSTGFYLNYRMDGICPVSWNDPLATVVPLESPTVTEIVVDNLTPGRSYCFAVWGYSPETDEYSEMSKCTCVFTTGPPLVTTQEAMGITAVTATLRGYVDFSGGSGPCWTRFQYGTDNVTENSTPWIGGRVTGTYVSELLVGLELDEEYYFRVQAYNESTGVDNPVSGGTRSFKTCSSIGNPEGLTADPVSAEVVKLSWMPGSCSDMSILVYSASGYPTDPGSPLLAYRGGSSSYTLEGLKPGTTYFFRVWSTESSGRYTSSGYAGAIVTTPAGGGGGVRFDISGTGSWFTSPKCDTLWRLPFATGVGNAARGLGWHPCTMFSILFFLTAVVAGMIAAAASRGSISIVLIVMGSVILAGVVIGPIPKVWMIIYLIFAIPAGYLWPKGASV